MNLPNDHLGADGAPPRHSHTRGTSRPRSDPQRRRRRKPPSRRRGSKPTRHSRGASRTAPRRTRRRASARRRRQRLRARRRRNQRRRGRRRVAGYDRRRRRRIHPRRRRRRARPSRRPARRTRARRANLRVVPGAAMDPSTSATATAMNPREATDAPAATSAPGGHRAMPRVDPVAIFAVSKPPHGETNDESVLGTPPDDGDEASAAIGSETAEGITAASATGGAATTSAATSPPDAFPCGSPRKKSRRLNETPTTCERPGVSDGGAQVISPEDATVAAMGRRRQRRTPRARYP